MDGLDMNEIFKDVKMLHNIFCS